MQNIFNETHVATDEVPPHPFYMRDNLCVAIARLLDLEALSKVRCAGARGAVITKGCYRHVLCFRPTHKHPHSEVGAVLELPEEVGNLAILRSDRFPASGIEGLGRHDQQPLFTVMARPNCSFHQFLGRTGPHFHSGSLCGNDVDAGEDSGHAPSGRYLQLVVCTVVSMHDVLTRFMKPSRMMKVSTIKAIPSYPSDSSLLDSYTWIDAQVLVSYGASLMSGKSSSSTSYDPFTSSFIMFVDALTGVVSPGGVDCVTKTHIPIRANFKGGKHPGQWRVGGEASFGWGGHCRFCTTTRSSTIDVTIPFEVMCFRPLIPAALLSHSSQEGKELCLQTPLTKKDTSATLRPILCFFRRKGTRISFPGAFLSSQVVYSRSLPPVGRRKGADANHIACVMVQDGFQRHLGAYGGRTVMGLRDALIEEESSSIDGGDEIAVVDENNDYDQYDDDDDCFTASTSPEDEYDYYEEEEVDVSFGDVVSRAEITKVDEHYGLFMCQIVSQADFHHFSDDTRTYYAELSYPTDDYVWVDASSLLSVAAKSVNDVQTCLRHPYDPVASFIMFADALTGVVSPGGVDCVTKTHIPIRANFDEGVHPGQWRVGGEASFGWGGLCHMCTDQSEGDCIITIPFEVMCHRPSMPSNMADQIVCVPN